MPTLAEAKQMADQGAIQQARLMYETIIQENPRYEEAWLGLADVLTEAEDKRVCYKNVLKINKKNRVAKEGLRSLEPQNDPLRASFDIAPTDDGAAAESSPPIEDEEEAPTQATTSTKAKKVTKRPAAASTTATTSSANDTPTPILVAFGLVLSVFIFAIGSGLVYYLLSQLSS